MSSRQVRKLQKQRELEQLQASSRVQNDSEESEDEAPIQRHKPCAFAGFAALGGQDDGDDEDDDNDDDNANKVEPLETSSRPPETAVRAGAPNAVSKKSKKKRKKGKKPDTSIKSTSISGPTHAKTSVDDIDEALRELDLSNKNAGASTGSQEDPMRSVAYERICELLRINTHHLKVVHEMRNLFGREAITAALNEENEERARTQRQRVIPQQVDLETYLKGQHGKTLLEVTLRRNPFLYGKDTWPRASTEGLTMRRFEEGEKESMGKLLPGTVEFGFVHDPNYGMIESDFFTMVRMHDPLRLVTILHRYPYHISSLIQVSKIAKQDQNSALSADLCERALFTFGRVALSGFRAKMEEGKARLDFRRPENRQFWLAGYHYLRNLAMKGTYRTALEWAKLLFSMDLRDPYGIIHFIHPMAIRAHESKWFIDFCDSEALDEFDTAQDYIRQTLVLARLQQQDAAGAKALLLEGMERLPWLYNSLYKSLNLDVPKSIWGTQPRDGHEELFIELYIHQTKNLWDNAQATSLLKEAAREAKKPDFQTFGFPPVVGRNVARFVYLDNTPSLMGYVPEGMLSTSPNWEFDPLPPPEEENIFSYSSQREPWGPPEGELGDVIPRDEEGLRRLLVEVQQRGAQPEFVAFIQEAIAEAQQEGDAVDEDDDEGGAGDAEPPPAVGPGIFQALLDLFNGGGVHDEASEGDNELPHDHWGLAESELENRMPGAWGSDSEDDDEGYARGPAA